MLIIIIHQFCVALVVVESEKYGPVLELGFLNIMETL